MLYMSILTWAPDKDREVVERRMGWKYPDAMKRLGEWDDLSGHRVFILFEADDPMALLAGTMGWSDLGTFETVPVMEMDELLKLISTG